jgi:hypothetical protein
VPAQGHINRIGCIQKGLGLCGEGARRAWRLHGEKANIQTMENAAGAQRGGTNLKASGFVDALIPEAGPKAVVRLRPLPASVPAIALESTEGHDNIAGWNGIPMRRQSSVRTPCGYQRHGVATAPHCE